MLLVKNAKAKFDIDIAKKYMAGIVLEGREVKSLRLKHASLRGSYVKLINGEAFLLNAQINPYSFAKNDDYDPKRSRKLLLSKKELLELEQASQQKGWLIVALSFQTVGRNIKVEIGLGKSRKAFEKKAMLKKRDQDREAKRQLKRY